MRPWSSTRMRSQDSTVASRCAITSVVRPCISRVSATCTSVSLSASSEEVASSSSSSGASPQDRPRDGDALALAAGQRDAALADRRVVALRQLADEFGGRGILGRPLDLGVGGVGPAEADVVAHAHAEDRGVLRHQRDVAAKLRRIGVGQAARHRTSPRRTSDRRTAGSGGRSCSCPRRRGRRSRASRRA